QLDPARYQRLFFGLLLVVMMIFRPEGIIPSQRQRLELHEEPVDEPEGAVIEGEIEPDHKLEN
ncbi:MAG: branched-chain amino acid ABC transporter permease, partial [Caldilineaceae bacterium]|nr:branched-chain amino acid ABC transporter permease [Caldilineaceae bacterium]